MPGFGENLNEMYGSQSESTIANTNRRCSLEFHQAKSNSGRIRTVLGVYLPSSCALRALSTPWTQPVDASSGRNLFSKPCARPINLLCALWPTPNATVSSSSDEQAPCLWSSAALLLASACLDSCVCARAALSTHLGSDACPHP